MQICGFEEQGEASRWAEHILGRALGSFDTTNIKACTGRPSTKPKALFLEAKPLSMVEAHCKDKEGKKSPDFRGTEAFLWKEKRSAEDEFPCDDSGKIVETTQV